MRRNSASAGLALRLAGLLACVGRLAGDEACGAAGGGLCTPAECREPDVMSVLQHIPPRECLERVRLASPLAAFRREGPGFNAHSCEGELFARLSRMQATADCAQVAAAGFMNYGLGSTMHYLMLQLQRALRDARPIAFVGEWVYGGCAARDFSCALDPISPCNKTGVPSLDYPRMTSEEFPWDTGQEHASCAAAARARGRGNALFRYVSTLAGFVFRANADMRAAAAAAHERLGLPARYLSVHVRNGDFCLAHTVTSDRKQCHALPAFAEALERLAGAYGIRDVYLATDTADAVAALEGLCPTLRFFYRAEVDRDFLAVTPDDIESNEIFVEQRLFRAGLGLRQGHLRDIMVVLICGCVHTHARTHTHAHTHTQTRTHARTHTHC